MEGVGMRPPNEGSIADRITPVAAGGWAVLD